mgnify:FL=1
MNNNEERPSRVQLYDSRTKKRGTGKLKSSKGHHPQKPGRGKKIFKILLAILLTVLLVMIIIFIVKQHNPI